MRRSKCYSLPEALAHQVEQDLESLAEASRLEALFAAAIQSPRLADFQAALDAARHD